MFASFLILSYLCDMKCPFEHLLGLPTRANLFVFVRFSQNQARSDLKIIVAFCIFSPVFHVFEECFLRFLVSSVSNLWMSLLISN